VATKSNMRNLQRHSRTRSKSNLSRSLSVKGSNLIESMYVNSQTNKARLKKIANMLR